MSSNKPRELFVVTSPSFTEARVLKYSEAMYLYEEEKRKHPVMVEMYPVVETECLAELCGDCGFDTSGCGDADSLFSLILSGVEDLREKLKGASP